ncbi:acyloxyacyl hydrolase [Mesobacterium pallidum]|uniref:acyloxyacyl hydrolase n=1 Tax=Mesobacterium pallidum TaxID=2872037 RepID=UPI001EE36494|nr:acyloxyacyl hydrolase [Mesobacterium pallidum]
MADGTFAVALLLAGLIDMGQSGCFQAGDCLAPSDGQRRLSFSAGEVIERQARPAAELYLRYETGKNLGPFGMVGGLSLGENDEVWVGFGSTYDLMPEDSRFFAQLHTMPGLYFHNGGFDLGGPVEFRSGIEFGYENPSGWRFGLSYDHRSNTGLFNEENPGIETVQIRVSAPLN